MASREQQPLEGSSEPVVLRGNIWGGAMGTYRGTVGAETRGVLWGKYPPKPEGDGDYDGEGANAGWAYSGTWRSGMPCGVGWRRKDGCVYAGEVEGGRRHGHGTFWSGDGLRCFEGEWKAGYPLGQGTMLREDGELWRVSFNGWTALGFGDGWDKPAQLARLGRVGGTSVWQHDGR